MAVELSVIIPTILRPTLQRLLESIPDDPRIEVIVVADTHHKAVADSFRTVVQRFPSANRIWSGFDAGYSIVGHPQRNYGASVALGKWLMFSQDDNVYVEDTFPLIFEAIADQEHPHPLLFKVNTWQSGVVWRVPGSLIEGNVDADCLVVPNIPEKLGCWSSRYQGDNDMIFQTIHQWQGDVDWRPELIAVARPELF